MPPFGDYGVITPIEALINVPYAAANVWTNSVITYEVLILLRATNRAQRITQPSLDGFEGELLLYWRRVKRFPSTNKLWIQPQWRQLDIPFQQMQMSMPISIVSDMLMPTHRWRISRPDFSKECSNRRFEDVVILADNNFFTRFHRRFFWTLFRLSKFPSWGEILSCSIA